LPLIVSAPRDSPDQELMSSCFRPNKIPRMACQGRQSPYGRGAPFPEDRVGGQFGSVLFLI